jgi:hypothetical protein
MLETYQMMMFEASFRGSGPGMGYLTCDDGYLMHVQAVCAIQQRQELANCAVLTAGLDGGCIQAFHTSVFWGRVPKTAKSCSNSVAATVDTEPHAPLVPALHIIQYDLHSSWWRAKEAGLVTRSIPVTFRSCVPQLARLHKYSFYTSVLQASFLPLFLFSPSRVSPTRLSAHSTVLCYSRPHSALVPEELVLVGC